MTGIVQWGFELGIEAWNEDQRLSRGQVSIPAVAKFGVSSEYLEWMHKVQKRLASLARFGKVYELGWHDCNMDKV